jgi:hypothetical protein
MGDTTDKKPDYMIKISFTLFGNLNGEDFPKELALQRRIRNIAEDTGRFKIKGFKFWQDDLEVCVIEDDDED